MLSTFEFSDNVFGIIVNTNVDAQMLEEIHEFIESKFIQNSTINLLVEINPGVEIPVSVMVKDFLFKFSHKGCFKKIAVVSEEGIFKKAMKFKDFLMKAEVQTFAVEDRLKAMNWITE